uniref:Uncharacterized protein n=1 Tax=Anguilla anguilla TaxID=7936 RepID=A0A0E9TN29_ANGAN
MIVSSAVF